VFEKTKVVTSCNFSFYKWQTCISWAFS